MNILELTVYQDGLYVQECGKEYRLVRSVNIVYKFQIVSCVSKLQ
jgi:hypothetical protein